MKPFIKILAAIAILAIPFVISCNSDPVTQSRNIVFPDKDVSYNHQVTFFMRGHCALAGCHDAGTRRAGYAFEKHLDLITFPPQPVVIEYEPDKSLLIQRIEKGNFKLNCFQGVIKDNHKKGMRTWVKEGAKNN